MSRGGWLRAELALHPCCKILRILHPAAVHPLTISTCRRPLSAPASAVLLAIHPSVGINPLVPCCSSCDLPFPSLPAGAGPHFQRQPQRAVGGGGVPGRAQLGQARCGQQKAACPQGEGLCWVQASSQPLSGWKRGAGGSCGVARGQGVGQQKGISPACRPAELSHAFPNKDLEQTSETSEPPGMGTLGAGGLCSPMARGHCSWDGGTPLMGRDPSPFS